MTGHDIKESECASVDGASTWTQQGYTGGDGQNSAVEDGFAFSNAAAALDAYRAVVSGMTSCQATSIALQAQSRQPTDAKVSETADVADAGAWARTWTGVEGISAYGMQTDHFYAAVDGTRLVCLQFTEFPGSASPYDTRADRGVLSMLLAGLVR